jgi:hypothetical protein
MNRRIIISVILTLIGAVVLVIITRSHSPFGKSNSSFASKPEKEITAVDFSQGDKHISLVKNGNEWLLNGNKETRKTAVMFLLRILEEIKIKSPVSPELFRKEITLAGAEPVKVKVHENRHLLKTFLVYGTKSNIYGNIMKTSRKSKPFIVYMPGFEGNIGSVFTLNELYWQPYTVFSLLPSEISSVCFENLGDEGESFTINYKGQHFSLADKKGELSGWDTSRVKRYLTYFVRIPFESWDLKPEAGDIEIIKKNRPLYRISVTTVKGKSIVLTLWRKWKTENGQLVPDSDRLFGKTQETDDLFIIRYFDIDPLLKKKSYFYPG